MANYYNEFDPKAAAWLRELIRAGHIPAGDVDERSIVDVRASDLRGYTQCHFFAGIGGWAEALRLAEWPSDRPVWTGSCPCQPFSVAGKGLGTADSRHLWPVFADLIRECRPAIAFGEQVASRAGRDWLAGVRSDLEGMGYAVGAADLCAAGVGAPHIRQRLYWVANAASSRYEQSGRRTGNDAIGSNQDAQRIGCIGESSACGIAGGLADMPSGGQRIDGGAQRQAGHADQCGADGWMGHASRGEQWRARESIQVDGRNVQAGGSGAWSDFDIIPCRDGKARRVESGLQPLAHGVPARVVRLRGYGNAIVPPLAAAFIRANREAIAAERTN